MKRILALFASFVAFATLAEAQIYPGPDGWATAKPEKYGYDAAKFSEIRQYVIDSTHATGIMVIVGGESIWQYGSIKRTSYIASCRKSVLSMLYGKYVENGTIDLHKTVGELGLDDIGGLLPIEKTATVYDLITARSGVYHKASNSGDDQAFAPERGSLKPGTYFLYNNWDFNAAGAAFEQMTGKNIYDALQEDIAVPVGMQDWSRSLQKKGGNLTISRFPAYHFYLSTRDMARIGYLMLRKGKWEDRTVISEDWIRRMTTSVTPFEKMNPQKRRDRYSYGYMWWLFDDKSEINAASPCHGAEYQGGYIARGAMGQFICVLPAIDMVIAFKTDSTYGRSTTTASFYRFLDMLLAARHCCE